MIMILKTIVLYFIIVIAYRIMGKKEVGELSIIDLIVTILMAELAAISIENTKRSLLTSIIPIISLVILQISLSYVTMKSNKVRNILDGKPSVIIKKGKLVFSEMTKIKYTLDDLLSQLREKGIKSIEEVDYAILENNGSLSVFQNTKDYPLPLIIDGVVDYNILKEIGKDKIWLDSIIRKNDIDLKDVFYAFYRKGSTYIIRKKDLI